MKKIRLDQSLGIAAEVIGVLKCCWQVELFFKWIKRRLRVTRFFGTS